MLLLQAFTHAPEANRVYNVDAMVLLKAMPSETVDLIVTSPPYNMRTNINGAEPCSKSKSNWGRSGLLSQGYENFGDDLPHEEYILWQRSILTECMRVLNDAGAMFYVHKWRIQGGLLDMRSAIIEGFPVRQVIIWNRGSSNNHNRAFFAPHYEVIYLIAKTDFYINQNATKYGDVWNILPETNNPHPAPFPVTLAERCILSTTAQLVVDPFAGSGTTLVAAQRLRRRYIGSDISPAYCELARRRLAQPHTLPMFATQEAS